MFMLDPDVHKPPKPEVLRTITAIEFADGETRVLPILLRVLSDDPDFDLKQAVRQACTQYALTEDGAKVWSYNCHLFDWADFDANVPNDICRQHGFEKVDTEPIFDEPVDWDEQLVDESCMPDDGED